MIEDLCILLVGHCVGDYPMQSDFLAKFKGENNLILSIHCILYTACLLIALLFTSSASRVYDYRMLIIAIIFITHFVIDKWKCVVIARLPKGELTQSVAERNKRVTLWCYYIDQALHMIINVAIYAFI